MTKLLLLEQLGCIEHYSLKTKFGRLCTNPFKYLYATLYRELIYKRTHKGSQQNARTFWGDSINILLPASTDIYLAGAKTHNSEIRLARFMVNTLNADDHFLDIGAHVGYFTLLASHLCNQGRVVCAEASPQTFSLLEKNLLGKTNINGRNVAISDANGSIDFSEFPLLYSEFNTMEKDMYRDEPWYNANQPVNIKIDAFTGSEIITQHQLQPDMIKIDVEGAEEKAIRGLSNYLNRYNPYVIMEFAHKDRGNTNHINAEKLLLEMGYSVHSINAGGRLIALHVDTDRFITESACESDNIVYRKPG